MVELSATPGKGVALSIDRFAAPPLDPDTVARMNTLCDLIEAGRDSEDVREHLDEWNSMAHRSYEKSEFESYYQSLDKEDFVNDALYPPGAHLEDLTFSEAVSAVDALLNSSSEATSFFLLRMLDANFPEAMIGDLIYWPDVWFGTEAARDAELTHEQIVALAARKAGRSLVGAPDLKLPEF
ncbi:MAG: hypothetical protein AAF658_22555 [Myxococcota bacterium]